VDGFLIGDGVLLRPLIFSLIERYGETHDILVVSGCHSRQIYADIASRIRIIELQFPWATYNYSFRSLGRLFAVWLRLFVTPVELALETRGDFRNIVWIALACPKSLIGFDFTGGTTLLTNIVPDDGRIAHVFEHTRRLGSVLHLPVMEENMFMRHPIPTAEGKPRIGISFAGSQPLKSFPEGIGLNLLCELNKSLDAEIWYIQTPQENIYTKDMLSRIFDGNIQVFNGSFEQYFGFLQTLSCYIGMDSGGGHLCSMFGIPSVIIFCTQKPSYCSPIGGHPLLCVENNRQLTCRPCDGVTCVNGTYQECLLDIDFNAIIRFIQNNLARSNVARQGTVED
jgi:ADP-heptose:LPS heptosyltransferase